MKYLYILICVFALTSCNREEWLDIKPKGVVIPTKTGDYRLLLDQAQQRGISPGFLVSYANTDLMADDFFIGPDAEDYNDITDLRAYVWNDNIYDPNEEDGDWAALYGQIYVTNVISEEIMKATGAMDEKLQIEAEAKVQNAFAYFSLVNLYAVHYDPATASSIMAVPFRNDTQIEGVQLPRASVQEIYDHVLKNLNEAIDFLPDLPESNTYKGRPTKAAVYAFLARVNLYMGKYQEARVAAAKALDFNSTLLNYNDIPDEYGIIDLPDQINDPEIIWIKNSLATYKLLVVDPTLFNTLEVSDQRRRKYSNLEESFGIPSEGDVLTSPFYSNFRFTGFSVPEMLMIRAECSARLGDLGAALADVNLLRQNRIATDSYAPLSSTNPAEVLQMVLFQRRVELIGQGQRFFDLKRFNQFDKANINITHTLGGQSETLKAGSKKWAVPVAKKYILETPEIGENVRN